MSHTRGRGAAERPVCPLGLPHTNTCLRRPSPRNPQGSGGFSVSRIRSSLAAIGGRGIGGLFHGGDAAVPVAGVRHHGGFPRRAGRRGHAGGGQLDLDAVHHRAGPGHPRSTNPGVPGPGEGPAQDAAPAAGPEGAPGQVQGQDRPCVPAGHGPGTDGPLQKARHQPVLCMPAAVDPGTVLPGAFPGAVRSFQCIPPGCGHRGDGPRPGDPVRLVQHLRGAAVSFAAARRRRAGRRGRARRRHDPGDDCEPVPDAEACCLTDHGRAGS